jgi:hypothetical protein
VSLLLVVSCRRRSRRRIVNNYLFSLLRKDRSAGRRGWSSVLVNTPHSAEWRSAGGKSTLSCTVMFGGARARPRMFPLERERIHT